MIGRARRQPVHARVDHDEPAAALHEVDDRMPKGAIRIRDGRHLAPQHHGFGNVVLGVVIASGQTAGVVHLGIHESSRHGPGGQPREVARVARLRVAGIGRLPHHRGVGHARHAALASGAAKVDEAFLAVFAGNLGVALLDQVQGLVPRDLLPGIRVSALGAVAFHGMQDAGIVVLVILQGDAAHAQAPLGDGMVLVALHLDQPSALVGVELESAADRMTSRWRPHAAACHGQPRVLVGEAPGLSQVVHVRETVQLHGRRCCLSQCHVPLLSTKHLDVVSPCSEHTKHDGRAEAIAWYRMRGSTRTHGPISMRCGLSIRVFTSFPVSWYGWSEANSPRDIISR